MYILKPEMAEELRRTDSKFFIKSPKYLHDSKFIATIGDICTIRIIQEIRIPDLIIVDLKTKRNIPLEKENIDKIENINCTEIKIVNKAGTISNELYEAIKTSIKSEKQTKIIIEGEEDLATLPVISNCKIGAKVIYGMPDKGMVVVDVNQQTKERANNFLEKMLVR